MRRHDTIEAGRKVIFVVTWKEKRNTYILFPKGRWKSKKKAKRNRANIFIKMQLLIYFNINFQA